MNIKKPKVYSDKQIVQAARILFYHDYKAHMEILLELERQGFKMIERENRGFTYKWTDVKKTTDRAFSMISDSDRDQYIDKAREGLKNKIAMS